MELILPLLIGGLVLFIFGITQLSESLEDIFTRKARDIIRKYTKNLFSGIGIGALATILLGSSSAVIIMTIIFINAKSLRFKSAMGIIMGANIGTTFSSQIIAMDIGQYAVLPMIIGLFIEIFDRSEKWKLQGRVAMYFGMLFFGLFLIQESVLPLQDSHIFEQWISGIESNYLYGTLIGGLITLIIQSSSATVGLAIILGKQDLITLAGGIALMMGSELGTCSDTLLATIKGSRQAIKAGIFHVFFNFVSICIGLLFFNHFVEFVEWISGNENLHRLIANAHVLFNVAGVILFLPFVGHVHRFLEYSIPERSRMREPGSDN